MVRLAYSMGTDRFLCSGTGADLSDGVSAAGAHAFSVATAGGRRSGRAGADAGKSGGSTVWTFGQREPVYSDGRGLFGLAGSSAGNSASAIAVRLAFFRR